MYDTNDFVPFTGIIQITIGKLVDFIQCTYFVWPRHHHNHPHSELIHIAMAELNWKRALSIEPFSIELTRSTQIWDVVWLHVISFHFFVLLYACLLACNRAVLYVVNYKKWQTNRIVFICCQLCISCRSALYAWYILFIGTRGKK